MKSKMKQELEATPLDRLYMLYDDYFRGYGRSEVTDSTQGKIWVFKNTLGDEILEVGAGNGFLAEFLTCADLEVYNTIFVHPLLVLPTDFSMEACRNMRGAGLPTVCCDAQKLPFKDLSFDTVVSSHVLEHVVDPREVLREMIRVSKSRVLLVVPDYISHDQSQDYHLRSYVDIRDLDKLIYEIAPTLSVSYSHDVEGGEIRCVLETEPKEVQEVEME